MINLLCRYDDISKEDLFEQYEVIRLLARKRNDSGMLYVMECVADYIAVNDPDSAIDLLQDVLDGID